MPVYREIECQLVCPDGPLKEYDDPEPQDVQQFPFHTKTVYVQAREATPFSIRVSVQNPASGSFLPLANCLSLTFYFDGVKEDRSILTPLMFANPSISEGYRYKDSSDQWKIRKYQFAKVEMTEDAHAAGQMDEEMLKNWGEIRVVASRFFETGPSNSTGKSRDASGDDSAKTLHEKAAKGRDVSHTVGLGQAQPCPALNYSSGYYIDTVDNPYAVFRFLYRSEKSLKNLDLIPRSPSPTLTISDDEPLEASSLRNLSRDALEAEILRLRKAPERKPKEESAFKGKVKREPPGGSSSGSKRRKGPVETIDLTDD